MDSIQVVRVDALADLHEVPAGTKVEYLIMLRDQWGNACSTGGDELDAHIVCPKGTV